MRENLFWGWCPDVESGHAPELKLLGDGPWDADVGRETSVYGTPTQPNQNIWRFGGCDIAKLQWEHGEEVWEKYTPEERYLRELVGAMDPRWH